MKRWRLDSIAFTMGLTIAIAMGLGFILQQLANIGLNHAGYPQRKSPRRYDVRFYMFLLPAKVVSMAKALDAIPTGDRQALITAAERPQMRIALLDTPLPHLVNSTDRIALLVRHRIQKVFGVHHRVIAALRNPRQGGPAPGIGAGEEGMRVEVALADGHWLLFTTSVPAPRTDPAAAEYSRTALAGRLAFAALLVLLLSAVTARRLATPLSELALAVEQLGANGDAPLLIPRGPRELKVTIEAFNRMQERLRRFNDDRVHMLAAMSHDLRTALTRLKLRIEIGETEEQKQKIIAELDGMSAMMGSVLSFARDDTKREPRIPVDLDSLVEGVCEDASDAGGTVAYTGSRGITVSGRPEALRRTISNLVDNAIKYGGSADVSLTSDGGRIVVAVEDHGPGIPRSEREKVFEPFYRIEGSRNPDTGGVGLGLSVARSIAREHGGDIVLANRKGGGLSARLELPASAGETS